jgi:hypothetical protein
LPRPFYLLLPPLLLTLLLSACEHYAAHVNYADISAAAIADKNECSQGDKEQCAKFDHAQDRCREMIERNDKSANGLICRRTVAEGVISEK